MAPATPSFLDIVAEYHKTAFISSFEVIEGEGGINMAWGALRRLRFENFIPSEANLVQLFI